MKEQDFSKDENAFYLHYSIVARTTI